MLLSTKKVLLIFKKISFKIVTNQINSIIIYINYIIIGGVWNVHENNFVCYGGYNLAARCG